MYFLPMYVTHTTKTPAHVSGSMSFISVRVLDEEKLKGAA